MQRVVHIVNGKRLQGCLTLFWLTMIPMSIVAGWIQSVAYVSALSLWALVASHGAWWAAATVSDETPHEVVEAVVEQTSVEPA